LADAKEVSGATGGAVASQATGVEGVAALNGAVVDGDPDCVDAGAAAGTEEAVGATELADAKRVRTKDARVANGLAGAEDAAVEGEASSAVVAVAVEAFGAVEAVDANGSVVAKDEKFVKRLAARLRPSTACAASPVGATEAACANEVAGSDEDAGAEE
jgi:hypothetical protein